MEKDSQLFEKWEQKLKKKPMQYDKFVKFVKKELQIDIEIAEKVVNRFLDDGNVEISLDIISYGSIPRTPFPITEVDKK